MGTRLEDRWTDDELRLMTTMWSDGKSASQIAAVFENKRSRCSVLSKVNRSGLSRDPETRRLAIQAAQRAGSATKLAKSERQRDETAQAMVKRRASGTLLRHPPRLRLVASVPLRRQTIEPPFDPYSHLRTENGLRRALADMTLQREIRDGYGASE